MPSNERRWQFRARGLCWACLQPMDDNDKRLEHVQCKRLLNKKWKVTEIRHAIQHREARTAQAASGD